MMEEVRMKAEEAVHKKREAKDSEDDTEEDLDDEYPQIFSNSNKVIMFAFLVTAIGVALPKILSPQLTEKTNSGCCGVQLPSDFLSVVVHLCQTLSRSSNVRINNMTEITRYPNNHLSFSECHKVVQAECDLDITNTEEISQLASCLARAGLVTETEETNTVLNMLETIQRKKAQTLKTVPYHHHQERPHLSPSASFNNLAMEERGRMGAHPASNSLFHHETVRSKHPAPGISRMPPIPSKMNMNIGAPSTPPTQTRQGGSFNLIAPIYAIGIVVFFIYTLWKIFFKNKEVDEDIEDEDALTAAEKIKWNHMEKKISEIGEIVDNIVKKGLDDKCEEETDKTSFNCKKDALFENKDEDTNQDEIELEKEPEDENVSAESEISPLISQRIKAPCKHDGIEDWREGFDPRDLEISLLKARLEETEKAMERIVAQMGVVTSRLAPHIIAQAFEGVDHDQDGISKKVKHEADKA